MGRPIEREHYSEQEYSQFSARLVESLQALKTVIRQSSFGRAQHCIGAELESYIVDDQGQVLPINREIIARADNPQLTVELNKFNLEFNFEPLALSPDVFSLFECEMNQSLKRLAAVASDFDAHIVPIGILPTLKPEHLSREFMTDEVRYRAMSNKLRAMRGEDFNVHIKGVDELNLRCDHVALEGANTSFQFHWMVEHANFATLFNAIQLTTPLVVAVAANSPVLLDKILWDETRIALFKQSIDSRLVQAVQWRQPSRVSFGHGWVRDDAWELFAENVALHPCLFPLLSEESPMTAVASGQLPHLDELSLHMGTLWPWNRPVYSAAAGGHVRVEMRALPAGPSTRDMIANVVFAAGLAQGLSSQMAELLAKMPFHFAEYNFYRAAQSGLAASIVWPDSNGKVREMPVTEVLRSLIPIAQQGLQALGIASADIDTYLSLIERRLSKHLTGAIWQKRTLAHFEQTLGRHQGCEKMFAFYRQQQASGLAVTEWELLT